MRKLYYIFFGLILLVSCSENDKDKANSTINRLVQIISESPTSKKLLEAQKVYNDFVSTLRTEEREAIISQLNKSIEAKLTSLKYSMSIDLLKPEISISTNIKNSFQLKKMDYFIKLEPNENPAFFINFGISGTGKVIRKEEMTDCISKLILYNSEKKPTKIFNIYPTPELKKILNTGEGETVLKIYLSPVWSSFSKEPLKVAAESFVLVENAKYFNIEIECFFSGKQSETESKKEDKKFEDLLDQLDKKK